MLSRIRVHNIGLIGDIDLELQPGFTVITGETGAGKSLLLSSFALLTGQKASVDLIQNGADMAFVEGELDIKSLDGITSLEELELEPEESLLAVKRTLEIKDSHKKEQVRIAGSLSSLKQLKNLIGPLVDMASQHDHIKLLEHGKARQLLDEYAGNSQLLTQMKNTWMGWKEAAEKLEVMRSNLSNKNERIRLLESDLDYLDKLAPKANEEQILKQDIQRLSHAQDISQTMAMAVDELIGRDEDLVSRMEKMLRSLGNISRWMPSLEVYIQRLESIAIDTKDLALELQDAFSRLESDPALLDICSARLAALEKAFLRYSVKTCEGLLELKKTLSLELNNLEKSQEDLAGLEQLEHLLAAQVIDAAQALTESRKDASEGLQKAMAKELADLAMPKARFKVNITPRHDRSPGPDGLDDVAFLLAANPGYEPREIAMVASGGELSRLLLAMKCALRDAYKVPVYIFDEIDSGIGGVTAKHLGSKLKTISKNSQVICVTHSAQIAAWADSHFVIRKEDTEGLPLVFLEKVQAGAREKEIARMMSGTPDSSSALKHSRELLEEAKERMLL